MFEKLQKSCWPFVLLLESLVFDYLPEGLDIVSTVGSSGEIRQVKLDLIPALIKSHGHSANKWLDTSGRLVIGGSESTTHVLVIQHLHLEGEVFLQLLTNKRYFVKKVF